ncbi:hypothetical protein GW17_00057099 [Ensete ventricosum]|nr:hypothetical protein GW17_00057099 [Ensete ventricosum]
MIRSYWELHFGEQCNDKKDCGFKGRMSWYRRGGSFVCVHRSLHEMKALVVSIWGLCTTEGEVRLQVPVRELLGGHSSVEAGGRKGRGSDDESSGPQLPKKAKRRLEGRDADARQRIVGPWAWQYHAVACVWLMPPMRPAIVVSCVANMTHGSPSCDRHDARSTRLATAYAAAGVCTCYLA